MGAALIEFNKFELRAPAPQNSTDIFSGKWASDLSKVRKVLDLKCSVTSSFGAAHSVT
jgi:hypothetical protein